MATSIRIDGIDKTIVELRALPPEVSRRTVLDMSQVAYDVILAGAERHSKTGALVASTYNRSLGPATRQVGHDTQRAPYAPYPIHGTPPHIIRPKNKKALRWVSGNGFRFAKEVHHPGNRPDDYITRAADEADRQFAAIVDRAIKGA